MAVAKRKSVSGEGAGKKPPVRTKMRPKLPTERIGKRELEMLALRRAGEFVVRIRQLDGAGKSGYWGVQVDVESESYLLETFRGELKGWRSLEDAVSYALETASGFAQLYIEFGSLMFTPAELPA